MLEHKIDSRSSIIHKLDVRIKVLMVLMFSLIIATGSNLLMLLQAFCFSGFLVIIARLSFTKVFKKIFVSNFFILGIWFFIPFSYPGEILMQWGPLTISREGIMYVLKITLRANAIMLVMVVLVATSTISSLMKAMKYYHVPPKLIYLFYFVHRYIYVIYDEFSNLNQATLSRGFKPQTNLATYKTYAYLIGFLLLKSYKRANRVYQAMLARGFNGEFKVNTKFSWSFSDGFAFLIAVMMSGWFIFVEQSRLLW
ncbi:MAG: cobalt ECF transporter T component CbiQ [Bacillota bacterium]